MAIDFLEIRSAETRDVIGIIDGAQSVIWHSVYYGCGDFEIYAAATEKNIELLQIDNYVTKPYDLEFAVIERVEYTNTVTDGKMIIATGRLGKSILDRRHIYKLDGHTNTPTILKYSVEGSIRGVVYENVIDCEFDSRRNIAGFELGIHKNYPEMIVDENGNLTEKQVSFANLLEYITSVLLEYKMSCKLVFYPENLRIRFEVYKGDDRSADNTEGNSPVIFSTDYDNLTESNYYIDVSASKNTALIGGEGEALERFYSLLAGTESGLDRRETFIDDSSITKTPAEGVVYTNDEYNGVLISDGLQKLAQMEPAEDFDGTLNINGGIWRIGEDYNLGDIVTIQDNALGFYVNVRINEITETQDENGYNVDITYSKEGV